MQNIDHLKQTLLDAAQMLRNKRITGQEYNHSVRAVKKALGENLTDGLYIKGESGQLEKIIYSVSELRAVRVVSLDEFKIRKEKAEEKKIVNNIIAKAEKLDW